MVAFVSLVFNRSFIQSWMVWPLGMMTSFGRHSLNTPQVLPLGVWVCYDLPSDIFVPVNDVILAYPIMRDHTSRSCVVVMVFVVEVLIPFV